MKRTALSPEKERDTTAKSLHSPCIYMHTHRGWRPASAAQRQKKKKEGGLNVIKEGAVCYATRPPRRALISDTENIG